MSKHRYMIDVSLLSPGELELVLRDELPKTIDQPHPQIYCRRILGVERNCLVIRSDIPLLYIDDEDLQKFEDFTQLLYEDQHSKLYPELET